MKKTLEEFLEESVEDMRTAPLAELLGAGNSIWRRALARLAKSSPCVATCLPDVPELDTAEPREENALSGDGRLILSVAGPPVVSTMGIDIQDWPFDPVIRLAYLSHKSVLVTVGTYSEQVDCNVHGDRMSVLWPEYMGIQGDIDIAGMEYADGFHLELTARPCYPAYLVSQRILDDNGAYGILEATGCVEAFVQAGEPSEKIAIAVLAVYKVLSGQWQAIL